MAIRFSIFFLISIIFISCSQNTELVTPAPPNSKLPSLYADEHNNIILSWVESAQNGVTTLKYSQFKNNKWTNPKSISSGNDWFINWADYPSTIASNGSPLAAHWLKKIPGGPYAYNINLKINQDNKNWSPTITPHKDSTKTEHGFLSMVPWSNNNILAVWLDGRKTADRTNEEYGNLNKAMTFRGAIFNKKGEILNKWLIDENVCDCCNTSLAKTSNGAVAVYRDRAENEIRDIYFTKLEDNSWSEPKPVARDNWSIAACPVNGPQIAVKDSTVLVAWFTGAGSKKSVKAATSSDLGETFSDPIIINENQSLGRVDAAISQNGQLLVSWMEEAGNGKAKLNVTSIDEGELTHYLVTEMPASRSSGFPQLEIIKGKALMAWTSFDENGTSQVNTKLISIKANL
ncbi:MAG: hypothetical protein U5J95_02305 [Balneolaceae bacterium]|nr:hypothetical protein [Balneolaceae bacterium]